MSLPAKLQSVLDTFDLFPDPADRTNLLLGYADQFREVPPDLATRPFDGPESWAAFVLQGDWQVPPLRSGDARRGSSP